MEGYCYKTLRNSLTYAHDAIRTITSIPDGSPQGLSQAFAFDELNRLVRADSDLNQGYATELAKRTDSQPGSAPPIARESRPDGFLDRTS